MKRPFTAISRATIFQAVLIATLAICLWPTLPTIGLAGGGPENVLLVVNQESSASMTIANHYIRLRRIPAGNVLMLPWDPEVQTTDIDTFRRKILAPVLTAIQKRRLAAQIDYIVYSSDYPWAVDLKADATRIIDAMRRVEQPDPDKPPRQLSWPKHLTQTGSINGLTYLWRPVMAGHPSYFQLKNNLYVRRGTEEQAGAATLGFRSSLHFGHKGELVESKGAGYMLSVVLGVTTGRGNSVDEVLDYLGRSATADGTHPTGTIYYVQNTNIRSKVRHHAFPRAVRQLKQLGVEAEIVEGTTPTRKHDVQGAMLGTATFNWKASGSTIRPGAICEHFTSFGGIMRSGADQTPLSEFLRYGAAGASGTVAEPYALEDKFPTADVQVHYARGSTLAEAFYQSIYGPYQLLIVGDPLCRPWANIPQVTCSGVDADAVLTGPMSLTPSATVPSGGKIDHFELFIDGWRRATCRVGEKLQFDTVQIADGYHEFRVVAFEASPIQSQGRWILPVVTSNHGRTITTTVAPQGTVRSGAPLTITARSPGSVGIAVMHNSRLVGRITGESGRVELDTSRLGLGPVRLTVFGMGHGSPLEYAMARPIEVTIRVDD